MPGEADFFRRKRARKQCGRAAKGGAGKKHQRHKKIIPAANAARMIWWGMVDSNHRRHCQQIYSLSPLATREIPHDEIGAGGRIRTPDLLITNQLLYQLSYTSTLPASIILTEVLGFVNRKFYKNPAFLQAGLLHFGKGGETPMTLSQLSQEYAAAAELISRRLALLRQAQRDAADPLRRAALERRIAALRPLLRECRQLQRLTAHYYDRSYCRDQRYRI